VVKRVFALVFVAGAIVAPSARGDTIPAPPACITVLPGLPVSCPPPAQSQEQSSHVQAAQRSASLPFAVAATPSLARALVVEVNRTRRAPTRPS
jgi:hypothetical protein